jgi:hypothetical protein
MKRVKGCDFNVAFKNSKEYQEDDLLVRYVHLDTLLQAKKAAGRHKDLDDIEKLTGQ